MTEGNDDFALRDLRYFVAVAEELHFGRAANRLAITQPSMSKAIGRLERQLGVQLLYRDKRNVTLTHAGSILVDDARRTIAQADNAARRAKLADEGRVGLLKVGFVTSATASILPVLIHRFTTRYPTVSLEFHELSTAAQMSALRDRVIDVGLARPPVWEKGVETVTIQEEPLVIALHAGHDLATRVDPFPLSVLDNEPLVLFRREVTPGLYDSLLELCHDEGFDPRIVHECNSFTTAIALVTGGVGISLIPESLIPALVRLGGVAKTLSTESATVGWAAVWAKGALAEGRPLEAFLTVAKSLSEEV